MGTQIWGSLKKTSEKFFSSKVLCKQMFKGKIHTRGAIPTVVGYHVLLSIESQGRICLHYGSSCNLWLAVLSGCWLKRQRSVYSCFSVAVEFSTKASMIFKQCASRGRDFCSRKKQHVLDLSKKQIIFLFKCSFLFCGQSGSWCLEEPRKR